MKYFDVTGTGTKENLIYLLDGRCSKRFDNLEAVFYFLEGGCNKIFDNLEAVFICWKADVVKGLIIFKQLL